MLFYRCKCGNAKAWASLEVPRCVVCPSCGSTLATGADHPPAVPHDWATIKTEVSHQGDVMAVERTACTRCLVEKPAGDLPASLHG